MSRVADNTNWLGVEAALGFSNYPVSIMCWMKRTGVVALDRIVYVYNKAYSTSHALYISNLNLLSAVETQSGSATATTTGEMSTDTWYPIIGTFDESSRHIIAIGEDVEETTTKTWLSTTTEAVTILSANGSNILNNSLVAHVAIWDVVLSSASITALQGGANPLAVEADNLVAYWPFTDAAGYLVDTQSSFTLTDTGTSYSADNPTVDAPPSGDIEDIASTGDIGVAGSDVETFQITTQQGFVGQIGINGSDLTTEIYSQITSDVLSTGSIGIAGSDLTSQLIAAPPIEDVLNTGSIGITGSQLTSSIIGAGGGSPVMRAVISNFGFAN